jgi:ATP-dependent Clp protease ATP-binding subunit ClpA
MFERYTESARHALFFARYDVTTEGGTAMEADHLLLGLLRIPGGRVAQLLEAAGISPTALREAVVAQLARGPRLPTSAEIPFSSGAKRVLQLAADEADRLTHHFIGPEHLLLGLLREGTSAAAATMSGLGLTPEGMHRQLAGLAAAPGASQPAVALDVRELEGHLDRIHALVEQLVSLAGESPEASHVALGAVIELQTLRQRLLGHGEPGRE